MFETIINSEALRLIKYVLNFSAHDYNYAIHVSQEALVNFAQLNSYTFMTQFICFMLGFYLLSVTQQTKNTLIYKIVGIAPNLYSLVLVFTFAILGTLSVLGSF